jgi:RNA polymerase sigma-70 factor (ECF subfamily)
MQRVRAGQEIAFEALFQRYYQRIHTVLHRLVGDEADDLAQEVFLRLYRQPPPLQGDELGAWLHRVALNLGYNALRHGKRQGRYEALTQAVPTEAWQRAEPTPEAETLRQDTQRQVRWALAQLKEQESALLVLRYSEMSYREIAAILGVRESSVGTLLARAERAFERVYAPYLEREGQR